MSTEEDAARQYVDSGPPYLGESHFRNKDAVKGNGGRWNSDHKKWEARDLQSLRALIKSNLWTPCGFSRAAAYCMVEHIDKGASVPVATPVVVGKLLFHRRDEENAKFDPVKDQQLLPNGKVATYARHCDTCGVLVDARLQFGLECDCPLGCAWKSCNTCSFPLFVGETCPTC
jgi:hypothetical protein